MRIAIAGLHTECASTSPLYQQRADFDRVEGDALTALAGVDFAAHGVQPCPIFLERAVPGGPVAPEVYEAQCNEILTSISELGSLDGVLLLMHGAYYVPGVEDPEGVLIARIRDLVGPDAVLSASFDLHGQITAQITDTLDVFAAYRTAPHIDVPQTRARAAQMLLRALKGPRPQVVRVPVPVLVSGEMSSTRVEPCATLYRDLPALHGDTVWDVNLMVGYVWADTARATAAAVVTCTDPKAGRVAAMRIAKGYWQARHELTYCMPSLPPDQALDTALQALPATLADSGDNPTAGGVGDRADILALLAARDDLPDTLVAGICAPVICAALEAGHDRVTIGAELGGQGPRVTLAVDNAEACGEDWRLTSGAITVLLTRRRKPFHTAEHFAAFGVDPGDFDLLVVKSGYLSEMLEPLPRTALMALTDGAVTQDFGVIPNSRRQMPIYPFQTDFDWSPT